MINPTIHLAPGRDNRPGRAHLSGHGYRTLCGRWIGAAWRRERQPSAALCRRCVGVARANGYAVPEEVREEPTP